MRHRGRSRLAPVSLLAVGVVGAVSVGLLAKQSLAGSHAAGIDPSIHKIKHVIVTMQENRSFDSYFGTFPGADGISAGVCLPDPRSAGCAKPWVDHPDSNGNNPHDQPAYLGDIAGGRMNGFVAVADKMLCKPHQSCHTDVMGYHVRSDIPNYWAYASNFVLQDHMFEAAGSWSLPAHLYEVSGWSAKCADHDNPMTCKDSPNPPRCRQTPSAATSSRALRPGGSG
jgi:phospholipase C